jgi:hypothetical protein
VPDGAGHRSSDDAMEHGDGGLAGHDQERSAPQVLKLAPPHLTTPRLVHQGSSAIASRKDATASLDSAAVGGTCR